MNRTRLFLIAAFAAVVAFSAGPVSNPQPVNAGTAATMEANLVQWINDARRQRGLPKLETRDRLMDMAGDRASAMASTGKLEHTNCVSCSLRNRGVSFSRCGEVIAYTTYPWGNQAAQSIFNGWKNSSLHWSLLMSSGFNRIGIGVAYRSRNSSTWAAGVLVG
jgi:uncharacterized protein YkwD